ncbi:MAG: SUMF1/EgtB/PvdO family nonheme iron enzyme [Bacteroidales bacterium]|jgi:gliding motility-associated lipoprotein GldJ|nr:SUMF1/EgtB/PvdO family nonheme iron enzyme [Bacteroidales bacterium]MEE1113223.1 SUMF1/EgtB/PvdO family nonheme iron enzyme [Bacteroidales bacterium]MEE1143216.1 SUMF1/EgtB/PvdO family nonheme iron enzyme [Bacteroidales bacterium]MEE1226595.1 SUMF1/EgtB/PvdO family nonheme iron enzyme [Bacteroidales bacterium]
MNKALISKLVLCFGIIVLFANCKGSDQSATTGWDYDNPEWGGFESAKGEDQMTPPGMVFIEGGSFVMGQTTDNVRYEWHNQPKRVTVSSFYMDECEITNLDYREYLYWLNRVYGNDYPEVYQKALPDTLVWRSKLSYNEPMVDYYFRHSSWADYPVVGVSWLQANEYCSWRTDRVNERILVDAGFLEMMDDQQSGENVFTTDAYYAGQYEGIVGEEMEDLNPNGEGFRKVKMEDGILLPRFRLPTEAEWEFAALSLVGNTVEERIVERRIYPWNGHIVRTAEKKYYGQMMANFKRSRGDAMGVASALNDHWEYTAPVMFYFPNDYGLYNMAGNVAEWVMDVYRVSTGVDSKGINPYRGNVYMTKVTDSDGMIAEKDSLGRISYRAVTVEENINRRNYRQSDNINYLDGDLASQLRDSWVTTPEEGEEEGGYEEESGEEGAAVEVTKETNDMYAYEQRSMVDDKARVVKGGSWKDRAFYLSPGQRRFLDQAQSTDWIGFRCAMDRMGSREL